MHERRELASTLGKSARAARVSLGFTQEQTAEQIGISPEFYARMERGQALPSIMTLWRMSAVLHTTLDGLLGFPRLRSVG